MRYKCSLDFAVTLVLLALVEAAILQYNSYIFAQVIPALRYCISQGR